MPISQIISAFQPQQVALLQKTFKDIVQEPWFDHSAENERMFAGMVVKSFQEGVTDEAVLSRYMRGVAQERFSQKKASNGN